MTSSSTRPPAVRPEPGWNAIAPVPDLAPRRSFVSGEPDGDRLRVAYFTRERDGALVGRVWFGPGSEGPPGYAHGGSVAAVLDEAMGVAAWLAGHPVVAARLVTNFRDMVRLGTDATFEAWVAELDGRKVTTRARLVGPDGTLLADADALFVIVQDDRIAEFRARGTALEP